MALTKVSYSMITGSPVNALDFGASPSASAAANTTALQAAIDYASSTHTELIIPEGIYQTSGTLYVDQNEVMIRGIGAVSTDPGASRGGLNDRTRGAVIQYTGTACALQVSRSRSANPANDVANPGFISNIQIHNLRIEVPANCANALLVFQPLNSYFFNIAIWGSQSTGGVATGTTLMTVRGGVSNIFEKIVLLGIGRDLTAPNNTYYVNFGMQLLLGWGNDTATTTIFRRCYTTYCNIGVNLSYRYQFEDCIFESCRIGIQCLADINADFERCWWEANIDYDISYSNSIVSIKDSLINAYTRQEFFNTGGGVVKLQFDNVQFSTTNANPFIFGVSPSGNNIFSTSGSTPKTILFNNCSFPVNTSMGFIYNDRTVNKIQILNMQQETLTFAAASVGASATPTMNGTSGFASYTMQEAGDVLGINIYASAAMTGGTYSVLTRINGTAIPTLSNPIVAAQAAFPFTERIQPLRASFAKGDVITVVLSTDSLFAPTNNICFEVIVAYGPSGEQA
jgi:hypothetical protein